MRKSATTRRARALTVVAAMATALVGMAPVAAVAGDGPDGGHHHKRGYVCDRLERDHRDHHHHAAVGSGRCHAINAPRRGDIRGPFTIQTRHGHHKVLCVSRHGGSGYANTPKWVRGKDCRRA
ncbi:MULTISPECIES: hypothetical protein [Streptomyces]|uniref:Uncharacterized protein n=1 Tax=Streptomyces qinglanensis TaxID=943816 RepID=A0A1E7K238_9ACTN|nr:MULTISPECIES: hypothetical protein [Streptomyces]MBE9499061.1 hypothetical protein [Streptomyces sp. GKU 257-1]OEU97994.1 hypothetical protein AN217_09260 [Streptomyces qinglanensis]OEV08030.1 hypothetical protein AN220_33000 [Streptomyces nanshensis]